MSYFIRVMLLEEIPANGRGRSVPQEKVLDEFEFDATSKRDGMDLMESLSTYVEDDLEKELFEEENDGRD